MSDTTFNEIDETETPTSYSLSIELGLTCSASLAQEGNFTFHAGGGSKWPQSPA